MRFAHSFETCFIAVELLSKNPHTQVFVTSGSASRTLHPLTTGLWGDNFRLEEATIYVSMGLARETALALSTKNAF